MIKNEKLKFKVARKIMAVTAFFMLAEIIYPTAAFALTSGPAQPEFSSFEPVSTTTMVNEFTGDFTYNLPVLNIPGANGGGYALSLSYHSGASPEEEASWVGYGWTLNPGAINRGTRGFPDDYKGNKVGYWNKMPKNQTVSLGGALNFEAFSLGDFIASPSASVMLRYNNYTGFGYTAGLRATLAKGVISLGYSVSDGEGSFSIQVNPLQKLSNTNEKAKESDNQTSDKTKGDKKAQKGEKSSDQKKENVTGTGMAAMGLNALYSYFTNSEQVRNFNFSKYQGKSYDLSVSMLPTVTPLQLGLSGNLAGNYTYQENIGYGDSPSMADSLNVYGYMYSAYAGASDMMDYYTEKSTPYNKRDVNLGIPFSNADQYMVTGEGIGGGFRLYNRKAGHFIPNQKSSSMNIYNLGIEVQGGLNWGAGADYGIGSQSISTGNWSSSFTNTYPFAKIEDSGTDGEPYFFRFNNDMGGSVERGYDDSPQRAKIAGGGRIGNKSFDLYFTSIPTVMNEGLRSPRSSYIAYHTNKEMEDTSSGNGKKYRAYNQNSAVNALVKRNSAKIQDGVGEICTFSEDGMRYLYGLPVYSKNEKNMMYGLEGTAASAINNNFLAYKNISNPAVQVGEERKDAYATTYLLTEINTPDYTDRTFNGPTDDDFGGWTKFVYNRVHGSYDKTDNSAWYHWRIPYTGLQYSRGEMSTSKDDMGTLMSGDKEIYYLDSIVTKTHFAKFIISDRNDSYGAADDITAANSSTAKDSNKKLKKLDRIELYARTDGGTPKLIQTVRFEYFSDNNALCQGIPNAASNTGKLTLKRVWIEYQGVVAARISPYEFKYEYPVNNTYPSKYDALDNYGGFSSGNQNPSFSHYNIDAWGNYQYGGSSRFSDMKSWVNQKPDITNFDPAAWQLKVIKLPSGGEIHVQYEQDDYCYVQDKYAHAMVSLKTASTDGDKYYLNIDDLNLADGTQNSDVNELITLITRQYITPEKKIYFKFLYNLVGNTSPGINDCAAEYISGYVNVKDVGWESGAGKGLWIKVGKPNSGWATSKYELPKQVCNDYLRTQRAGSLNSGTNGNCSASVAGIPNSNDPKQIIMAFNSWRQTFKINANICAAVNFPLSFFRIPMNKAKKGGGLRVKRLMMYDPGIETGDKNLYGNEYVYETYDYDRGKTISSGVATNEPSSIREENALVEFNPRLKQSFFSKIIAGRDKKQTELPLGESILPSPSVGYSKIMVKNIFTGKTAPGFVVKEFFTAKEHPFVAERTEIEMEKDYFPLSTGFYNYFLSNLWLTQGFTFKCNEMHGKPRAEATYGGDPSDMSKAVLSSKQEFVYFSPGESIPVMVNNCITSSNPGKETDLVFEIKAVKEYSNNLSLEGDVDVGVFGLFPVPFVTAFPSLSYTESEMYSHVTTKVINYPAILKYTKTYSEGIYHISENLAFDSNTGKPALTRTVDGYDKLKLEQSASQKGSYHSYDIMAAQKYKEMGQKAENERIILTSGDQSVTMTLKSENYTLSCVSCDGSSCRIIEFTGTDPCKLMNKLFPGDLVRVTKKSDGTFIGVFNIAPPYSSKIPLLQNTNYAWNSSAGLLNQEVKVEVIKSGRTNELNESAGNISTYGDTINLSNILTGTTKLYQLTYTTNCVPNCSKTYTPSGVFEAAATSYKDCWGFDVQIWGVNPIDANIYQTANAGKWRPEKNYVYKTDIIAGNDGTNRNYKNAGIFNSFTAFDYGSFPSYAGSNDSTKWVRTSIVKQYSPDGNAIEEMDNQWIYSCAKYGYDKTMPYLSAQNSVYDHVQFESFEKKYASQYGPGGYLLEDGWGPTNGITTQVATDTAHSGKKSWRLNSADANLKKINFKTIILTQQLIDKGILVKVWVKDPAETLTVPVDGEVTTGGSLTYSFKKVARSGEWSLYEANITNLASGGFTVGEYADIWIRSLYGSGKLWIDDVRIQPMDAEMTTYVYDAKTLRLLTSFDSDHFGLYYQYDSEGKLVRKLLETEKGIRTVQEAYENSKKIVRP